MEILIQAIEEEEKSMLQSSTKIFGVNRVITQDTEYFHGSTNTISKSRKLCPHGKIKIARVAQIHPISIYK